MAAVGVVESSSTPAVDKKAQIDLACSTAENFCKLFYDKMDNKRHTISKMYLDTATASWNGNKVEGGVEIQKFYLDKLPKSEHQVTALDAQPVASNFVGSQTTILVVVAGHVSFQDSRQKPFQQNFLLTARGDHWKIATDTFRHQEHSKPKQ